MAMKDLGKKQKELYGSPSEEKNKIVYPDIDMPLSVIEGMNLKVDDDVSIHIKGRVSGMQDTKWTQRVTFEARQADIKKSSKTGGKSILDEA